MGNRQDELLIGNVYKVNGTKNLMIYIRDHDKNNIIMFDRVLQRNRVIQKDMVGDLAISIVSDEDREKIIKCRLAKLVQIIKSNTEINFNARELTRLCECDARVSRNIMKGGFNNIPEKVIHVLAELGEVSIDDILDCHNNSILDDFI